MRARTSLGGAREALVDDVLGSVVRYPSLTDEILSNTGKEVGVDKVVKSTDAAVLMKSFGQLGTALFREILALRISNVVMVQRVEILDQVGVDFFQKF